MSREYDLYLVEHKANDWVEDIFGLMRKALNEETEK